MRTSGHTILITGGGSGIGRGLAHAFHAAGNQVIVAGRRREALEETAQGHAGMAVHVLDVDSADGIAAFAREVTAAHPSLSVLVNNAGIMRAERLDAEPVDLSHAEATIATNLLGPMRLTAALLPHLKRQPEAAVINVTSGLAFVPLAMTPAYSATKAALHSWTQSLRHQMRGTSVEVIELAPPLLATELTPGQSKNPRAMPLDDYIAESMALLARNPTPREILVERVMFQRRAEAEGRYDAAFATINPAASPAA